MADMIDMTGQPPSAQDIDDAIAAAVKLANPTLLMTLPPQIGVNVMNIVRCLRYLKERL